MGRWLKTYELHSGLPGRSAVFFERRKKNISNHHAYFIFLSMTVILFVPDHTRLDKGGAGEEALRRTRHQHQQMQQVTACS